MENEKRRNTIIAIVLGVGIVALLIVVWVVKGISKNGETGGLEDQELVPITTDIHSVVDAGFPEKLYTDFSKNFYDAMIAINPTCNKQATAKNVEKDDETYNFSIVRCNTTYNVELINDNSKNYIFTISKDGEQLVSYNSEVKGKAYLSKQQIAKFLPMSLKTANGTDFSIKQKQKSNFTDLEVSINNCGSEEIKNSAISAAKDGLELAGFNPEDFTYDAPDYCDGEM